MCPTSRRKQPDERLRAAMQEGEEIETGGAADPQSADELRAVVLAGDLFTEVYKRRQPSLLRYLNRLLGNPATAEEVSQETWLKVVSKPDTFDGSKGSFRAWLFGVAHNAAIDWLRRHGREILDSDWKHGDEDPGLDGIVSNAPSPDEVVFGAVSDIELFRVCLEKLPAQAYKAVRRCVIEEEPFNQVAEALGMPEQNLRRLCRKAVRSVQWCMRKKGYRPGRRVVCEDARFEVALIDTTPTNPDAYDVVVWVLDPSVGRSRVIVSLASVSETAKVDVDLDQLTFDNTRFGDCHEASLAIANAPGTLRASVEVHK